MATLQQLTDDTVSYLNRRDCLDRIPGWVATVETEIAETCRTRAQVVSAIQAIDAPYIALPADFATMESICDATTGEMLVNKDAWTGHWSSAFTGEPTLNPPQINYNAPATAYRLKADCIEILPHPTIPDPPDPNWVPQQILMGYYQRPKPLLLPSDTNPVLERYYTIYLYGVCKHGAIWALDDDRANQMDTLFQQSVTRANLWKQQSDYSGAPYRAELYAF